MGNQYYSQSPELKARQREMTKCRTRAMRQLTRMHKDEFRTLLHSEYAKAGLEVRKHGMSAAEKKQRKIDRLKAQLAALESN